MQDQPGKRLLSWQGHRSISFHQSCPRERDARHEAPIHILQRVHDDNGYNVQFRTSANVVINEVSLDTRISLVISRQNAHDSFPLCPFLSREYRTSLSLPSQSTISSAPSFYRRGLASFPLLRPILPLIPIVGPSRLNCIITPRWKGIMCPGCAPLFLH